MHLNISTSELVRIKVFFASWSGQLSLTSDQPSASKPCIIVCIVVVSVLECDVYPELFISALGLRTLDLAPRSEQAKPSKRPWEECESVYKRSHLRKRAAWSIYYRQGPGWNTSHWHQQHRSSLSMLFMARGIKNDCIMYSFVYA
jgi:hypothetical protein